MTASPVSTAGGLMTVDDVCAYLSVSRHFVYAQVRDGQLRASRIARQLRFRLADIDDFVDENVFRADEY